MSTRQPSHTGALHTCAPLSLFSAVENEMVSCTKCENRVVQFHGLAFANFPCKVSRLFVWRQSRNSLLPALCPCHVPFAVATARIWFANGQLWIFKSVGKCTVRLYCFSQNSKIHCSLKRPSMI